MNSIIIKGGGTLSLLMDRVHGGLADPSPPLVALLDLNILSLDLNVRLDDIGPETYFTIEKVVTIWSHARWSQNGQQKVV